MVLDKRSDDDIDYSDIPPLNNEFFDKAMLRLPATQAQNLIQIDPDVISWFKSQSVEYKTLINSVLRKHIENSNYK